MNNGNNNPAQYLLGYLEYVRMRMCVCRVVLCMAKIEVLLVKEETSFRTTLFIFI